MKNNRERLAWTILLVSFVLCIGLIIGIPVGARSILRTASVSQDALLEPQQGTLRVQRRGRGAINALIVPSWDVPPGTVVTTDSSAQGLLTIYPPNQQTTAVTTVQIYGNTEVVLRSARSPFATSPLPHQERLEVRRGRVRITVAPANGRDTVVQLNAPYLTAQLGAGSYEVRAYADTELTVREGRATVSASGGEAIVLEDSQRTVAGREATSLEVLDAARNLLINGSFRQPLEGTWTVAHDEQLPPAGAVEVTIFDGRPAARFSRTGDGHAAVYIEQEVNYDVRDFSYLALHLSVQVREQSLTACGSLGSECPIIVRIDYKDIYGNDQTWYYGFYALNRTVNDWLNPWDKKIPFQVWVAADLGNLLEASDENPIPITEPALIKQVTIYASGHTFDALVTEVELLAHE